MIIILELQNYVSFPSEWPEFLVGTRTLLISPQPKFRCILASHFLANTSRWYVNMPKVFFFFLINLVILNFNQYMDPIRNLPSLRLLEQTKVLKQIVYFFRMTSLMEHPCLGRKNDKITIKWPNIFLSFIM